MYGSVRGAARNGGPYRDSLIFSLCGVFRRRPPGRSVEKQTELLRRPLLPGSFAKRHTPRHRAPHGLQLRFCLPALNAPPPTRRQPQWHLVQQKRVKG